MNRKGGPGGADRGGVKVLFFGNDAATVEEMVLALRLQWPDMQSTAVDNGSKGLHIIEQQEPELAIICDDLSDMAIWEIIKEIRRFAYTPILVAARAEGRHRPAAQVALQRLHGKIVRQQQTIEP